MGFFDVGDVGVDIERLPLITDGPIYVPVSDIGRPQHKSLTEKPLSGHSRNRW